ncbi:MULTISPECIES: nickel-responsive transcriptional regulator NikR [Ramlibacter]|uniref:nickel-responsive transcriptional regulator NikR n=1 Tax=Ramlibacter TaxID=174951 RepID=UPI0025797562|nr:MULTISPECIES: nickel-responsive transcriptional regulator NikR [Ramlibacter]
MSRIGVSLPAHLLEALDGLVARHGYESRSQAIAEVVHEKVLASRGELGDEVMVGTITLHYDRQVPGLQKRLADIQYENIDEVISSLHVHLSENQVMEVILVQGRAPRLSAIANEMLTRRGVIGGRLQLHAAAIPPIQLPAHKARPGSR